MKLLWCRFCASKKLRGGNANSKIGFPKTSCIRNFPEHLGEERPLYFSCRRGIPGGVLLKRRDSAFLFPSFFFFFLINLFIYLFLAVLGLCCCAHGLSLVAASGGYSSLRCTGFSLWWLRGARALGAQAQ